MGQAIRFAEHKRAWVYVLRFGAAVIALGVLLTPAFPQEIALLNSRAPKVVEWLNEYVGVDLSDESTAVPPAANTTWQQQRIRQQLKTLPTYLGCYG